MSEPHAPDPSPVALPGPPPVEPPPEPQEQEISLDELTAAFAQAMGYSAAAEPEGSGEDSSPTADTAGAAETPGGQSISETADADGPDLDRPAPDATPLSPSSILEAMLFVGKRSGTPLTSQEASDLMRGVDASEIPALVEGLNRRYDALGSAYHIVEEGPGYRMTLRHDFYALREQFYGRTREARLSQAALDILAIVAYRQPITAEEISQIRGRPAGPILLQLVRRQLLRIERPQEGNRAPRYHTAPRFLELFNLRSLGDLPQSEDLDRL